MNNIFENAYFGKAYKTRDGRKAVYIGESFINIRDILLIIEGSTTPYVVMENGHYWAVQNVDTNDDIISEWQEPIVCKCEWENYHDYRIMMPNGEGHVRVSFFQEETIISDLFVAEEHRHKGYASILLNEVDKLLNGKVAIIYPLKEWQKEWYEKRGYVIGEEEVHINEEKLDELAWSNADSIEIGRPITINHVVRAYKAGRKSKEE